MAAALLRLGTRGSPLALAQAAEVRRHLAAAFPELATDDAVDTVIIRTTGDQVRDRTLAAIGGKGLFTKELEEALAQGAIDLAVHSLKDMPTWLPDGLAIAAVLPREDARDAFLSARAPTLAALPPGAVVGTASLRRRAQVLYARPDLRVVPLRGNVGTRLKKLADGAVSATILALAGLKRLGQADAATAVLPPEEMLPAVAQGAIGIETRVGDRRTRAWAAGVDDAPTAQCVAAERALLAALDGSCRTPIAAHATLAAGVLSLRALVIRPDGSERHVAARSGPVGDAAALGADAGAELKAKAGPDFFDWELPEEPPA